MLNVGVSPFVTESIDIDDLETVEELKANQTTKLVQHRFFPPGTDNKKAPLRGLPMESLRNPGGPRQGVREGQGPGYRGSSSQSLPVGGRLPEVFEGKARMSVPKPLQGFLTPVSHAIWLAIRYHRWICPCR